MKRSGRGGPSVGSMSIVAAILFLLTALPAAGDDAAAAERPIPVSCLYLHSSIHEDLTGKRAGRAEIAGGFYPALKETYRSTPPESMAALVILIDWADQEARPTLHPPSSFEKAFFHTTPFRNETVRDYYLENSNDRFRLGGEVTAWLRSSLDYSHYVNGDGLAGTDDDYGFDVSNEAFAADPYPSNVWGIVREAFSLADEAGVDFSLFDNDGPDRLPSSGDDDGVVDALIIVHAGRGAEQAYGPLGPSEIWSHKSDMNDPAILGVIGPTEADGVRAGPYNLVPEYGETGVYAHEFGHILGLPDLYRTTTLNGSTIQESTVGFYCLMDAGSLLPTRPDGAIPPGAVPTHMNPFFKTWLGWLEPDPREADDPVDWPVPIEIDPVERGGAVVRLLSNPGGIDWEEESGGGTGEYFLLENRQQLGFDSYLPGAGMLIWHIGERRPANESDDIEKRLCLIVEAADGAPGDLGTTNAQQQLNLGEADDFWPAAGKSEWTADTDPSSDLHGGRYSGLSVTGIDLAGARIRFDLEIESVPTGEITAFPNPFRPDEDSFLTIVVDETELDDDRREAILYDVAGGLVRVLDRKGDEMLEDGKKIDFVWDGRNDTGREVASGIYLYIIPTTDGAKTGKIAVLR